MTCGLSGNALVPSEPLYTELVCRRGQPPPFPHLARAESPYVVWSFPGGRAEHESGAFSPSISAVEGSLGLMLMAVRLVVTMV